MLTIVIEIWFYTIFFSRLTKIFAEYSIKTWKTGERQKKLSRQYICISMYKDHSKNFIKTFLDLEKGFPCWFRRFYLFSGCFLLRCKCIWGRKYLQLSISNYFSNLPLKLEMDGNSINWNPQSKTVSLCMNWTNRSHKNIVGMWYELNI